MARKSRVSEGARGFRSQVDGTNNQPHELKPRVFSYDATRRLAESQSPFPPRDAPLGCRLSRDSEVCHHAAVVSENDKTEQDAERRCWNGEKVNADDIANVVVQERPPRLRWRVSVPNHVLVYGRLGYIVAKQLKFGVNPRGAR